MNKILGAFIIVIITSTGLSIYHQVRVKNVMQDLPARSKQSCEQAKNYVLKANPTIDPQTLGCNVVADVPLFGKPVYHVTVNQAVEVTK